MFSLCFGKIAQFPVFSLTGIFFGHFPGFPCAVGTLCSGHPVQWAPCAVGTLCSGYPVQWVPCAVGTLMATLVLSHLEGGLDVEVAIDEHCLLLGVLAHVAEDDRG